ncbi:uncharacterized protein LOC128285504 [Gossypium arboreum]|uniref:uncharacterized protein LOC128285504 n=1 Tax=Gossypium arboreum TaxID=29729 RepID=UPI0022F15812|nr:uncharacterized protein LOC128285504 [Gossypium arboreum]
MKYQAPNQPPLPHFRLCSARVSKETHHRHHRTKPPRAVAGATRRSYFQPFSREPESKVPPKLRKCERKGLSLFPLSQILTTENRSVEVTRDSGKVNEAGAAILVQAALWAVVFEALAC